MDAFIDHLLKNAGVKALISEGKSYTYNTLVHDIITTEYKIRKQIEPQQKVFEWDFESNYKNIVLLFAIARCKGIIVPVNSSQRLFHDKEFILIECLGEKIKVYKNIENVFTQALGSKNSAGLIISTSGTGGIPKDTVQDLGSLCNKYYKLNSKFTTVLAFSLEHISGIETLLSILCPGGTVILVPGRSPHEIAEAIKKHKASLLSCTPTFLIQLYLKQLFTKEYFQTVKTINCGGEPLTPHWYSIFKKAIPWVQINQAFGTTEASLFKTETHPFNSTRFRPGIFNTDYCVKENILFLRNQNFMLGDWNENEINTEPWIETTDIVEVDVEGYIVIVGRKEKMISVGGKKVNPIEVESILLELKDIKYAKVYGETNPIMGQIVVADVLSDNPDEEAIKKQIREHCSKFPDDYKMPTKIKVLKEMHMTHRLKR